MLFRGVISIIFLLLCGCTQTEVAPVTFNGRVPQINNKDFVSEDKSNYKKIESSSANEKIKPSTIKKKTRRISANKKIKASAIKKKTRRISKNKKIKSSLKNKKIELSSVGEKHDISVDKEYLIEKSSEKKKKINFNRFNSKGNDEDFDQKKLRKLNKREHLKKKLHKMLNSLNVVDKEDDVNNILQQKRKIIWPVQYDINDLYKGNNKEYLRKRCGEGAAIYAKVGEAIRAISSAIIDYAGNDLKNSGGVIIMHYDDIRIMYSHIGNLTVKNNGSVTVGEIIGEIVADKKDVNISGICLSIIKENRRIDEKSFIMDGKVIFK